MQFVYMIALIVASIFIQAALAPKPAALEPASFDDFDFPQIDEGTPQCVFFGECWTGDWQVLATGNYRTTPVKAKSAKK